MRILFATDGSATAETALEMLLDLRLRSHDHVTVLAVPVRSYLGIGYDGTGAYVAEIAEGEERTAHRVADDAAARLRARNIPAEVTIEDGPPAHTIIEVAQSARADLIVMGSRGLGRIAGALLGSTARAVARHSEIPVLVVRDRRNRPSRVLLATDGSEDATAAIATFFTLPFASKTDVTILHVQPKRELPELPPGIVADELIEAAMREEHQRAIEIISQARDLLLPAGVRCRLSIERGRPVEQILATAAAEGTDLIVLGARGGTLKGDRFLQGSTADRILENAHCAVLVARARKAAEVRKPSNGKVAVEAAT